MVKFTPKQGVMQAVPSGRKCCSGAEGKSF